MALLTGFGLGFAVAVALAVRFGIAESRFSAAIARGVGAGPDLASVDSLASFFRTGNARVSFRQQVVRDIDSGKIDDPQLRQLLAVRRRRFRDFAVGAPLCLILTVPWSYAANALWGSTGSAGSSVGSAAVFGLAAFGTAGVVAAYQVVRLQAAGQRRLALVSAAGLLAICAGLAFLLLRLQ